MHPNRVFHVTERARNVAFLRERSFGTLAINGPSGPLTAHIPFLVSQDGTRVEMHLVRSGAIARAVADPQNAVLTVLGPDSYISPDWYGGVVDQVPTWNYVAVRVRGVLRLEPQDTLEDLLARQSAHMEERIADKVPWTSAKMSDGVMARMMPAIVPLSMHVDSIEGTWKMSQNKSTDVRLSAAQHVAQAGLGTETSALAKWMREVSED